MPFDFRFGGCNTFRFGIMLCFSFSADQECHSLVKILFLILLNYFSRFDGTSFKTEPSSKFRYVLVLALGSYRDSPFVTGGLSGLVTGGLSGLKTEILNYNAQQWFEAKDYPFTNEDRQIVK